MQMLMRQLCMQLSREYLKNSNIEDEEEYEDEYEVRQHSSESYSSSSFSFPIFLFDSLFLRGVLLSENGRHTTV